MQTKANLLILFSSVDGQTRKIAFHLKSNLQEKGLEVHCQDLHQFTNSLSKYTVVILGAGVRYGKHNKEVHAFINQHEFELNNMNSAFYSVNLVARKNEKNTPKTNPYLIKFLKQIHWKPKLLAVFAGKLHYQVYSFWDRIMIKLIMKMTGGPTHTKEAIEYTQWKRVDHFAENIITKFKLN